MQAPTSHILYCDDDETVWLYLRHLGKEEEFEAVHQTALELTSMDRYFWSECFHLRYPDGGRDGVVFYGAGGHSNPSDNGFVMMVVRNLYENEEVLERLLERIRGLGTPQLDLPDPAADIHTSRIKWVGFTDLAI